MSIEVASNNEQLNSGVYYNEKMPVEKIVDSVEIKEESQDKEKETDKKEIKNAIKKINTFLQDEHTHAEYSVHKELNRIMIKIVDDDTHKVILEIPPKKLIDMVAKMCELAGVLVDKKA